MPPKPKSPPADIPVFTFDAADPSPDMPRKGKPATESPGKRQPAAASAPKDDGPVFVITDDEQPAPTVKPAPKVTEAMPRMPAAVPSLGPSAALMAGAKAPVGQFQAQLEPMPARMSYSQVMRRGSVSYTGEPLVFSGMSAPKAAPMAAPAMPSFPGITLTSPGKPEGTNFAAASGYMDPDKSQTQIPRTPSMLSRREDGSIMSLIRMPSGFGSQVNFDKTAEQKKFVRP